MKLLITFSALFLLLVSCNDNNKIDNEINLQVNKFDYNKLVYPENYYMLTQNPPIHFLKELKIPEELHNNESVILKTCELVIAVNKDTYKNYGQTYPLEVNLDVVKIIKNNYTGELFFPVKDHIFLSDLSNAANIIKESVQRK